MCLEIDCIKTIVEKHPRLEGYALVEYMYVVDCPGVYDITYQVISPCMLSNAKSAGTVYWFPPLEEQ